jgi:hypothetical protein
VNEAIAVEVRLKADGAIRPLAFSWRGKRYRVASIGRQWEQDGERHFLVMTPDERVYELAYLQKEGGWRLRRRPQDFRPPRPAV